MERLRALFEALELADVETFIASGNVIFRSAHAADALERRIEAHLRQELGYAVDTFLRTPPEVAAAAGHWPFDGIDPTEAGTLYVGFLRAPPADAAREKVVGLRTDADEFAVHGREMYWFARAGMGQSKITGAKLEKALGMPTTLRNVTTVRKLAEKYAE